MSVQVTAVPTLTVITAGLNAKFAMLTEFVATGLAFDAGCADGDAVGCGVAAAVD
jgi:hypothetical protein